MTTIWEWIKEKSHTTEPMKERMHEAVTSVETQALKEEMKRDVKSP